MSYKITSTIMCLRALRWMVNMDYCFASSKLAKIFQNHQQICKPRKLSGQSAPAKVSVSSQRERRDDRNESHRLSTRSDQLW